MFFIFLVELFKTTFLQGGESLIVQRQQLEELYLAHPDSMSILLEEDDGLQNQNLGLPRGPANFTLLWYECVSTFNNHVVLLIRTMSPFSQAAQFNMSSCVWED